MAISRQLYMRRGGVTQTSKGGPDAVTPAFSKPGLPSWPGRSAVGSFPLVPGHSMYLTQGIDKVPGELIVVIYVGDIGAFRSRHINYS